MFRRSYRRDRNHFNPFSALLGAVWWVYKYKLHLALFVGILITAKWLEVRTGGLGAAGIIVGTFVILLTVPLTRGWIDDHLYAAKRKRQWTKAVIDAGLADPPSGRSRKPQTFWGPRALKVQRVNAGDLLSVRVHRGGKVSSLTDNTEVLKANLDVREVRVTPHPTKGSRAEVLIVRNDPFHEAPPVNWPLIDAEELSLWEDVPIGLDENNNVVKINLVENSLLIGGQTRSGKSVAFALIAAAAALDPNTQMWCLDGKGLEFAHWESLSHEYVGVDRKEAKEMLERLRDVMDERYKKIREAELLKVNKKDMEAAGLEMPLILLAIDELPFYLNAPKNSNEQTGFAKSINALLADILARCLASGIIVVAAAQKPTVNSVPSDVRDNFTLRLALRCGNRHGSETILGDTEFGDVKVDASSIPRDQKGVGYLLYDGERPDRIRCFNLEKEDRKKIADRVMNRETGAFLDSTLSP
jgi:S-DNA-T family DNA segregation ATPase FtsK/SpoIIIE